MSENPRYQYQRQWRLTHQEQQEANIAKWNRTHPNRPNGNRTRTSEQIRVWNKVVRMPIASACELCGSIDSLQRHHPDYQYPEIYVTVCGGCHNNIHKGIENV